MTVTRICSDLPNYCMDYYLSDCIRLSNVVFAVKYLYFNTHTHTHKEKLRKKEVTYRNKGLQDYQRAENILLLLES